MATLRSAKFSPEAFFEQSTAGIISVPANDDLATSIRAAFALPNNDTYVYRAIASVTLHQVQEAIVHGGASGMHAWYKDDDGNQIDPPPVTDIDAYTSIFVPTTSTSKALAGFVANAKKGSLRASIAAHLSSKRTVPPELAVSKVKKPPPNPYLEFWAWSCRNLEWAGPNADTVKTKQSHHILPIFYHHFGCVCPSHEALCMIQMLVQDRDIIDAGSGNGYWTYMMRRMGLSVQAVDNGDSLWRTTWISDIMRVDAAKYMQRKHVNHGRNAVLLLVYPQATGAFTTDTLKAYDGSTICVAGTQNANGYTAFQHEGIEDWMKREKAAFKKTIQTPLPSFAGKDEAFFVFQRE